MTSFTQRKLHSIICSGNLINLKKGQVFQSTDFQLRLSYVKKGYIQRYIIKSDGTKSIQSIYGAGYVFPLSLFFKNMVGTEINEEKEVVYYEAISPTEIVWISYESFSKSLQADPTLYEDILFECSRRFRSNIHKLDNTSLETAEKKVAHELVFLAKEFGRATKNRTIIQLPLTHEMIANMINVSRETVSTSMSSLKSKGYIDTFGRLISVKDIDTMFKYAVS